MRRPFLCSVAMTIALAALAACGGGSRSPGVGSVRDTPPTPAIASEPVLRVGIAWGDSAVAVNGAGRWWIREAGTREPIAVVDGVESWRVVRLPFESGLRVIRPDGYVSPLHAVPLVAAPIDPTPLKVDGIAYAGELEVQLRADGTVTVINIVHAETYLEGVVTRELGRPDRSAYEALKAQVVAARTYAMKRIGSRAEQGFDVYGSVLDQAYGGVADEADSMAIRAVRETRGEAILYNGLVIDAYYHSTCGGHTIPVELVFDDPPAPYLTGVSDARADGSGFWCQGSRYFRWTVTLDGETLRATIARNLPTLVPVPPAGPGVLRDLEVLRATAEGRVITLAIETSTGRFLVSENDIRILFSDPEGQWLRSTLFLLRPEYEGDRIDGLTLVGGGWGHGVGMCQVGAMERARSGQTYREIVGSYYPGTSVARLY